MLSRAPYFTSLCKAWAVAERPAHTNTNVMKTAPIADFPHLHHRLVSRRKGMEQRVSVMDQVDRRTAGPKSTHRPSGAMERALVVLKYVALMCTLLLVCGAALAQTPGRDPNRIRTVVLDAGHGGKDPGNLGTGRYKTTEKHVSLNVAKLVGKYITETYPDVKVVYTREDDTFIELMERCNIANRAKADVFISIHCNANDSKGAAYSSH